MTPVAPRRVNDVSDVTRINHESHFAWQAQYLVMLERHLCYVSYVTRINHESDFSWQAQYLVMLEGDARCSAQCK